MSRLNGLTITDALRIPTGAAAGKIAVCDASGNLSWQTLPTFRNWIVPGLITVAQYIPPIFITEPAWAPLAVTKVRAVVGTGTSATFKLQKNGVDMTGFTSIVAGTTASSTTPTAVALADDDLILPVITAISGTPANLTIELVMA